MKYRKKLNENQLTRLDSTRLVVVVHCEILMVLLLAHNAIIFHYCRLIASQYICMTSNPATDHTDDLLLVLLMRWSTNHRCARYSQRFPLWFGRVEWNIVNESNCKRGVGGMKIWNDARLMMIVRYVAQLSHLSMLVDGDEVKWIEEFDYEYFNFPRYIFIFNCHLIAHWKV